MKKTILLAFASILFFAACEEKPSTAILGQWQVTDEYYISEFGIHHQELEGTIIYDFRRENKLVTMTIFNGDTNVEDNLGWGINGDTLFMYEHRSPGEEPGMPGVMQILKLTEQEMSWDYLILGKFYIDLKRI